MRVSDKRNFPRVVFRLLALVVWCFVAATVSAQGNEVGEEPEGAQGVFHGEIDVSVINLYVTVVDKEGRAVPGLSPEDFEITENGEKMEITNFAILEHGKRVVPETVDPAIQEAAAEGASTKPSTRHVAVLFDLPSLQRRNKGRVAEAVGSLVREGLADGDRFMVAANSGELEILSEFSSYEGSLMATLEGIAQLEDSGDAHKRSKRMLKRTIHTTQLMRMRKTQFGGGVTVDESFIRAQAGMLQTEITNARQYEYMRIDQSIGVADELVRALAGIDGPKAVLWIGEDLAMRPAYDLYQVFYKKASFYQDILQLSHPEIWGREVDLSRQFQRLAASAQSCGATFHVIDASDRDSEMGSADYGSPGVDDIINNEAAGNLWTPGTDTTEFWDVTEGADYMALATGGSVQKNTRDLEGSVARIREQMVLTYFLGYQRPGAPDGKISSVQVKVDKPGLRVRHHEKVLNKTGDHHLADLALSRVRFDIGGNSLGMSVVEGQPQPGDEGKIVRSIQFRVPVESLVLMPNGEVYSGDLVAAVAVLDGNGRTAEPRLMRLSITIPSDRYLPDAVAARTLRLLMAPDTRRVAIGIRDETSGLTSTAALDLTPVEAPAEDG
ncbi:MAG: VWA domain-containing protein [Acidobacteriota bacterium]